MTDQPPRISKSQGQTPTETFLAQLCDRTFLKLWSYANPFKKDGKELCDLIAIFENHVFLFFDRESKTFAGGPVDVLLVWERWRKEVVDKQIKTANGAHRYVSTYPSEIYLDSKVITKLPVYLPNTGLILHKIVVAHGAAAACKQFSSNNVSGSLAISYGSQMDDNSSLPFMVNLDRDNPVRIFDSHNLAIILSELDTVYDFVSYLTAKEDAIKKYDTIMYCGEEDLLAHYFFNFDKKAGTHFIGTNKGEFNAIFVAEGEWDTFKRSEPYRLKKLADRSSYLWDDLLQLTTQNALDGTLTGDADLFSSQSAIFEMAKEPRFSRRALSDRMRRAVMNFPDGNDGMRNLSVMPSFYEDKAYVFLQIKRPNSVNFDNEYRSVRTEMLKIACGVTKNKLPHLNKVIGIAIDAPKFVS